MLSLTLKRIPRLAFFVRTLLTIAAASVVFFLILLTPEGSFSTETWELISLVFVFGFYGLWLFYAVCPRCRDIGLPVWAALAMFLPVVNAFLFIVFLGKKSESEEGRSKPPENNARDVT